MSSASWQTGFRILFKLHPCHSIRTESDSTWKVSTCLSLFPFFLNTTDLCPFFFFLQGGRTKIFYKKNAKRKGYLISNLWNTDTLKRHCCTVQKRVFPKYYTRIEGLTPRDGNIDPGKQPVSLSAPRWIEDMALETSILLFFKKEKKIRAAGEQDC